MTTAELRAGRAPARAPSGCVEGVRWLVDNESAYDALLAAFAAARRSIWISQLAFDADCFAPSATADGAVAPDRRLIDALIAASAGRRVDVRILLNASLLLDTARPLRAFLRHAGAPRIQVRGIARFPQLLHAKLVVVDGAEAFLVGSPFVNGYWDDSRHQPHDARRPRRELGGRPLHDVTCAITGAAVAVLSARFAELWNDVSVGERTPPHLPEPEPPTQRAPAAISVVCTAPRRVLPKRPGGATEILNAIEAGLARARTLVYVEHQYLSSRRVVAALAAALARAPRLEVIMVLNQNPDVTAYRVWQNTRLRDAGLLDHPRVGLFSLWSAVRDDTLANPWQINQVFVHSKVLLVDDEWACVGSANLDGVSLHSYGADFASALGRRVFRHARNFDLNVVIDERRGTVRGAVRELRERLWSEHLGTTRERIGRPSRRAWLARWCSRAQRNVAALVNGDHSFSGFVLPYSRRATPAEQLAHLGVDAQRVHVEFDPSWVEVHCSPNWIRNMFA